MGIRHELYSRRVSLKHKQHKTILNLKQDSKL